MKITVCLQIKYDMHVKKSTNFFIGEDMKAHAVSGKHFEKYGYESDP